MLARHDKVTAVHVNFLGIMAFVCQVAGFTCGDDVVYALIRYFVRRSLLVLVPSLTILDLVSVSPTRYRAETGAAIVVAFGPHIPRNIRRIMGWELAESKNDRAERCPAATARCAAPTNVSSVASSVLII